MSTSKLSYRWNGTDVRFILWLEAGIKGNGTDSLMGRLWRPPNHTCFGEDWNEQLYVMTLWIWLPELPQGEWEYGW